MTTAKHDPKDATKDVTPKDASAPAYDPPVLYGNETYATDHVGGNEPQPHPVAAKTTASKRSSE